MGKANVTFNKCMKKKKYFADCMNVKFERGVFEADKFYELDTVLAGSKTERQNTYEKRNDIKMYW